jgi:hypothetical protein
VTPPPRSETCSSSPSSASPPTYARSPTPASHAPSSVDGSCTTTDGIASSLPHLHGHHSSTTTPSRRSSPPEPPSTHALGGTIAHANGFPPPTCLCASASLCSLTATVSLFLSSLSYLGFIRSYLGFIGSYLDCFAYYLGYLC